MKIGILTYHRSQNYGALLQALALLMTLKENNHDVSFIDYFPKYNRKMYAIFDIDEFRRLTLKRKIKFFLKFLMIFPYRYLRRLNFNKFIKSYITPNCKPLTENFDCVVYGSDQIWRKQPYINNYNSMYFGKNDIATKLHISYAASVVELPKHIDDKNDFLELISNLNSISVREYHTKEFIEQNSNLRVRVDLDPTLLLSGEQWLNYFKLKRIVLNKYILIYDLQDDFGTPTFSYAEIQKIADQNNLQIVRLRAKTSAFNSKNDRHTDGPIEFLSLIYFAEYVFTSSFHGLIFSLLFERQVYCSFPKNALRAKSLLSALGISDRFLEPQSIIPSRNKNIDYQKINKLLNEMRQNSLSYLENIRC